MDCNKDPCFQPNSFIVIFHHFRLLYKRKFRFLAQQKGLYPGQPLILMALMRHDGCTQKELCTFMDIKPGSMTEQLQRMEASGFIERKPDEKDLRVTRVYIQKKGLQFIYLNAQLEKQLEEASFQNFTSEEKQQFLDYLKRMTQNLSDSMQPERKK